MILGVLDMSDQCFNSIIDGVLRFERSTTFHNHLTTPQGPGRVLTTALLLMVFSHKFTNNQCPISILWRVVNSLLTSKPRCQSGPGAGRDHVSTQKQGET